LAYLFRDALALARGRGPATPPYPETPAGRSSGGKERGRIPIRVHVQPSATACIFWLKNRRKDLWRERPEVEQPLGFDPNQSIEELRDELLRDMAEAGLVKLLPAPKPPEPASVPASVPPAGVANRKPEKAKH